MDWKLEVVIAPVADVERAREFYVDKLGFTLDNDFAPNENFRVIQVTPPGSACSIVFGTGLGGGVAPGSLKGAQLVVEDIEAAHAHLEERGIANSGPAALRGRSADPRRGTQPCRLRHVRLLRRPRRQLVGGPGGPEARAVSGRASTEHECA
jgi:catechol 2,3-dioxygenase-like lactoylglutathione lyase family enzyme